MNVLEALGVTQRAVSWGKGEGYTWVSETPQERHHRLPTAYYKTQGRERERETPVEKVSMEQSSGIT